MTNITPFNMRTIDDLFENQTHQKNTAKTLSDKPTFEEACAYLGVNPKTTSYEQFKQVYKTKSKVVHPDAGGSKEEFQKLTKAFEAYKDKESFNSEQIKFNYFNTPYQPNFPPNLAETHLEMIVNEVNKNHKEELDYVDAIELVAENLIQERKYFPKRVRVQLEDGSTAIEEHGYSLQLLYDALLAAKIPFPYTPLTGEELIDFTEGKLEEVPTYLDIANIKQDYKLLEHIYKFIGEAVPQEAQNRLVQKVYNEIENIAVFDPHSNNNKERGAYFVNQITTLKSNYASDFHLQTALGKEFFKDTKDALNELFMYQQQEYLKQGNYLAAQEVEEHSQLTNIL